MGFLEDLCSPATLHQAWEVVAKKRGVAGIDRVSVAEFGCEIEERLQELRGEISAGTYKPLPAVRIRPPFLAASDRALVVPAVRDRVLQRALADLLTPHIEPTLSPACRAFRKGHSAMSAADDVGKWVESGTPWVLRADVKKFFDRIRPEVMLSKLEPFVDARGLQFLQGVLRYRVLDHHQLSEMVVGIAQGSPLSPLLGNLYLSAVDHALLKEYAKVIRYCDDLLVLGQDEAEVRGAGSRLTALLEPLGLELNSSKTRICRAEDGFTFLGHHFGATGRGPAVKAVEALAWRLEALARSEEVDLAEVDALFRGWRGYFGHHPHCWSNSLAGVLALLRAKSEDKVPELAEKRWKKPFDATLSLALALARAWKEAGHVEHSWLELTMACGGSRASLGALTPWADVLGHKAESLSQLARRCVGAPGDRLTALTDGVAELSEYEVARRLAGLGGSLVFGEEDASGAEGSGLAGNDLAGFATAADLQLLMEFFQGREGLYAMEAVGRTGHRVFSKVAEPIDVDLWKAHLGAEKTLALPVVRSGDMVLLGVLDIDIAKKVLADQPGARRNLLARALATALRLRKELENRGASALLELSGSKGYHLWVRLEEPVSCFKLRRWLLDVVRAVSPLPEGVRVEEFPNRDRVRPEAMGPVVKLPLGVHGKTGRRCHLLDGRGEPLKDPFEAIRTLPRMSPQVLGGEARQPSKEVGAAQVHAEFGPRVRKVLEGCRVLAHLARHVEATSYLNHRERSTLLCTLGHLGKEGAEALHVIIGRTFNYREEVTTRHIDRLPSWPISCPKIRELHPEACAAKPCNCPLHGRGRGYPTPLLHALKPAEIAEFSRPAKKAAKKGMPATQRKAVPELAAAEGKSPEELVQKLAQLKRQRRGLERAISRLLGDLATLFEEHKVETLELPLGTLRRMKLEDGWEFVIEV